MDCIYIVFFQTNQTLKLTSLNHQSSQEQFGVQYLAHRHFRYAGGAGYRTSHRPVSRWPQVPPSLSTLVFLYMYGVCLMLDSHCAALGAPHFITTLSLFSRPDSFSAPAAASLPLITSVLFSCWKSLLYPHPSNPASVNELTRRHAPADKDKDKLLVYPFSLSLQSSQKNTHVPN